MSFKHLPEESRGGCPNRECYRKMVMGKEMLSWKNVLVAFKEASMASAEERKAHLGDYDVRMTKI